MQREHEVGKQHCGPEGFGLSQLFRNRAGVKSGIMSNSFSRSARREEKRNWMPFLIGGVALLAMVAAVVISSRAPASIAPQASPYSPNLKLSDVKLSAAENYVGGTVTYLDANITNTGDRTLTGAQMRAVFKSSMGQVVQTETLFLHVLVQNQMAGYPDLVDLSRVPIGPGQTKTVRMTLDHISADWDNNPPEMQLVSLKLK